jgi:hypothetical protein
MYDIYSLYCNKLECARSRTTDVRIKNILWMCYIAYIATSWKVPVRVTQRSKSNTFCGCVKWPILLVSVPIPEVRIWYPLTGIAAHIWGSITNFQYTLGGLIG